MKVIRPAPGEGLEEALRRLAAEMLNLESGAVAFGPGLEPLPGPGAPYPLVAVPPETARGLGCQVHYQPASGVVYYTLGPGDSAWAWAQLLKGLLGGAGTGHLERPRAVAAAPQGVFRARGRVTERARGRTRLADPGDVSKQALACREIRVARREDGGAGRVGRGGVELPPVSSAHAVFTWHFEPAACLALLGAAGRINFQGRLVNAMVAGVLFDAGGASALGDGATTLTPAGVFAPPPPPYPLWGVGGMRYRVNGGRPPLVYGPGDGLLLLVPSGGGGVPSVAPPLGGPPPGPYYRVTYVGHGPGLRACPPGKDWGALPFEAWDPDALLQPYSCVACEAPIGGEAVLVRGARHPGHNHGWLGASRRGPIVPAGHPAGVLLCRECWRCACDLRAHLEAAVFRTAVPLSQAAAGVCAGLCEGAVALLSGRAYPVAGVPGAFVVYLAAECPGGPPGAPPLPPQALEGLGRAEEIAARCRGEKVLITGADLGPCPAALQGVLARLALPALSELRIAVRRE